MSAAGAVARLEGVRKIAVLRPNAVGDFVFALPALHALKRAYPEAELVLLGLPWHAAFLAERPGPVDRVLAVPPLAGVGLAPGVDDGDTRRRFVAAMQDESFDIACQMYGGGRYSNPLVSAFGARPPSGARAGTHLSSADGAPALDRWVPYAEPANRRLALLEVAALAGAAQVVLEQELAVTVADREAATAVLRRAKAQPADAAAPPAAVLSPAAPVTPGSPPTSAAPSAVGATPASPLPPGALASATLAIPGPPPASAPQSDAPLVLLQPGSSDPRRCWPPASFAAVGDALAAMGARIAVNGSSEEAPLVRRVIRAMRHPAIDLSGKLDLGGLCGLIERAACVVSNDTGPLHLALAIGTPGVGIFWLTNLIEGAPLRPSLLHAALSLRQDCPVCGLPNRRQRCSHEASFVADVPVEQVIRLAQEVLGTA
jgi:ADP-heptose:LPS heptosyltransferase